jgi:hypothetical protein
MRRQRLGFLTLLAVATATWTGIASPALADTPLGHTGNVGAHSLNDGFDTADRGVTCAYGASSQFVSIEVNAPNIYARDKTAGVDTQKVGWRYIVTRQHDSNTPVAYKKSTIVKGTATDSGPALLANRTDPLSVPFKYATDAFYVKIKMFWYRADGTIAGTATNRVDYYIQNANGSSANQSACLGVAD